MPVSTQKSPRPRSAFSTKHKLNMHENRSTSTVTRRKKLQTGKCFSPKEQAKFLKCYEREEAAGLLSCLQAKTPEALRTKELLWKRLHADMVTICQRPVSLEKVKNKVRNLRAARRKQKGEPPTEKTFGPMLVPLPEPISVFHPNVHLEEAVEDFVVKEEVQDEEYNNFESKVTELGRSSTVPKTTYQPDWIPDVRDDCDDIAENIKKEESEIPEADPLDFLHTKNDAEHLPERVSSGDMILCLKEERVNSSQYSYNLDHGANILEEKQDAEKTKNAFSCSKCDYTAKSKQSLQHHRLSIHEGVRYHCDQCSYVANHARTLNLHRKNKHLRIRFPCDRCDYVGIRRILLKLHMQKKHRVILSRRPFRPN